eukprot:g2547.t1
MSEQYSHVFIPGLLKDQTCDIGNNFKTKLKPYGIDLEIVSSLGGSNYFDATISKGLAAVEALYEKHKKPLRLIGSSMGGLIAAIYAQRYPQNVNRLILRCPAFNLETNWPNILAVIFPDAPGEVSMNKWKDEGQLTMCLPYLNAPEPISYNYVVDTLSYPAYPLVDISVLVFSSLHDTLIPAATHQEWKKRQKNPEKINIVELNDGHDIRSEASWDIMISAIVEHFD